MVCLLKIYEAKTPALATAVAHDHCAGDAPELAKDNSQKVLVDIAANIAHIDIAKLPWLSCTILLTRQEVCSYQFHQSIESRFPPSGSLSLRNAHHS